MVTNDRADELTLDSCSSNSNSAGTGPVLAAPRSVGCLMVGWGRVAWREGGGMVRTARNETEFGEEKLYRGQ